MKITYSDSISTTNWLSAIGLSQSLIDRVAEFPDSITETEPTGKFKVALSSVINDRSFCLMFLESNDDGIVVHSAYRLLSEFVAADDRRRPLEVLQRFTDKFGLMQRVGRHLNRFILQETIHVGPQCSPAELIHIENPSNHPFHSELVVRMIGRQGDALILECNCAFTIDTDEYFSWLAGVSSGEDVAVVIAEAIKPRATPLDFITSEGTLRCVLDRPPEGRTESDGYLFRIVSKNFHFEGGVNFPTVYLRRNSDRVQYSIPQVTRKKGKIFLAMQWTPTKLQIIALDEDFGDVQDAAEGDEAKIEAEMSRRQNTVSTAITTPPPYIRRSLVHRSPSHIPWETSERFVQDVTTAFQSLCHNIKAEALIEPFWNTVYSGNEIKARLPKKETAVHAVIELLLRSLPLFYYCSLLREPQAAGGSVDFLITGQLSSGRSVSVCAEFKCAHSSDLENGLSSQLPAYMRAKESEAGLYCVLWFKGRNFDQPRQFPTQEAMNEHLIRHANDNQFAGVRTLIFDLSETDPPSKL